MSIDVDKCNRGMKQSFGLVVGGLCGFIRVSFHSLHD